MKILKNFKKVFINFSGYHFKEINFLLNKYKKYKNKIILLYGFQAYPSKFYDLRLSLFDLFKKKGFKYGYSDHTYFKNDNELVLATSIAITKGVKFIEKHICLNQNLMPPDYITALEFDKFKLYVSFAKKLFDEINKENYEMLSAEKKYHNNMRKFLFMDKSHNIKKYLRLANSNKKRI